MTSYKRSPATPRDAVLAHYQGDFGAAMQAAAAAGFDNLRDPDQLARFAASLGEEQP